MDLRIFSVSYMHSMLKRLFFSSFQGGDPIEFKKINDAYNRLISHTSQLERIEAEAQLSRTSVLLKFSVSLICIAC